MQVVSRFCYTLKVFFKDSDILFLPACMFLPFEASCPKKGIEINDLGI